MKNKLEKEEGVFRKSQGIISMRGSGEVRGFPLIVPRNQKVHFISTINIGDQIRDAVRKAGFFWRLYDLRHYFATQTLEAESKGTGLIRDFRVFFRVTRAILSTSTHLTTVHCHLKRSSR